MVLVELGFESLFEKWRAASLDDGPDPADSGGDRLLFRDVDFADQAGALDLWSPAELLAEGRTRLPPCSRP
jgi:hypothetical protein